MEKKQQQFSIWYFIAAFIIMIGIQNYFASSHLETISYSQFKSLVKKGLVADLVVAEKTIRGNIKGEGIKEVLPPEKLKESGQEVKDGKQVHPFIFLMRL